MQGVAGTVRRATPADIEDLRAVYGRSWRAAYGPFVDADQLDELGSRRVQRAAWSAAIRTSTCALFVASEIKSWRDSHVLVVTSTSNTRCCFSGDPSLDLTADALALTDAGGPNGSGPCAGFSLIPTAGTGRRDLRPARSDVNARSGARTGLCSVAVAATAQGESLYAPCDADGDCTSYGGGTCTLSPSTTQQEAAGVFLLCAADTAATLDVDVESIRR